YDGQIVLATNPNGALALLRKRLQAAARLDEKVLDRLVADLESETFAIRERATDELAKLGRNALPAIRARVAKTQSLEGKRRLTQFLERNTSGPMSTDDLRFVRALEFLEHMGTPGARAVIESLTSGEAEGEWTRLARDVVDRLKGRMR